MHIIDQKLQDHTVRHHHEERNSFMMRMIGNVNHLLVQSFEEMNQKADDKHQIMN